MGQERNHSDILERKPRRPRYIRDTGTWPRRHQFSSIQYSSILKSEYWLQIHALFFEGFEAKNNLTVLKILVTVMPDVKKSIFYSKIPLHYNYFIHVATIIIIQGIILRYEELFLTSSTCMWSGSRFHFKILSWAFPFWTASNINQKNRSP